MANPKLVVSSREDDFLYYNNLAYLRSGLDAQNIHFVGYADVYQPPQFLFQANRTYDFTRTAKATVRENMTGHLMGVLNPTALQEQIRAQLRAAFDCLYDYYAYRGCLEIVRQQRYESLNMLIFYEEGNIKFVAHVTLSSTTIRAGPNQYSVDLALTCQRFSYFPLQVTEFDRVLEALKRLH